MKIYRIGDEEFKTLLNSICELVPSIRFHSHKIATINQSDQGVVLSGTDGKKIASVSQRTLCDLAKNA